MHRSHTCGELRLENSGTTVTLSGWVQKARDLGGMTFVDLRDRYGKTQLVFNMETNADLCNQARKLGREFVIKVSGNVIERERVRTSKILLEKLRLTLKRSRFLTQVKRHLSQSRMKLMEVMILECSIGT